MDKTIDLIIQIVNFNTKSYLIDCLQSVESTIKVIGPKLYDKQGITRVCDHGENKGQLAKVLNELGKGCWKDHN